MMHHPTKLPQQGRGIDETTSRKKTCTSSSVMQGQPHRMVQNTKGLDIPYGSECVLEDRILDRKRQPEGPFGEFPGYYQYPVIEIDRVLPPQGPDLRVGVCWRPW